MSTPQQVDILLTHAYRLWDDPTEQRMMRPYAPLGILSLAAYLNREGHAAGLYDSTFAPPGGFAERLRELRPPIVGISVNMRTRKNAVEMIGIARGSGATVVVGGPEPANYAEEFLASGADVVVIGEGERTLAELMGRLGRDNPRLHEVQGIVFNDRGTPCRTAPRPLVEDLDSLPVPAREGIDLGKYMQAWRDRHGYASLSVSTMRGCPYTCAWCSHAVYGHSYRRRSPGTVVDELQLLVRRYNPEMFWFADDVFTINKTWLRGFGKELEARNLRLSYECISRADRLDQEAVELLRATGCRRLWIGTESGSQRVLDRMSRGVTVGEVASATRLARAAGIEVGYFLMLGYDGETPEDVEATVEHVRNNRPDLLLTTLSYPIKGTAYYEAMRGRMSIPPLPFAQWNDREIAVIRRLSSRYYWFAHRRLTNEAAWVRRDGPGRLSAAGRLSAYAKAKVAHLGMVFTR